MLTADKLRAIVERDRRDREYIARVLAPQEPSPRDAALEAELGPLPSVASVVGPSRAEQDRADLLALLRAVRRTLPDPWQPGDTCRLCHREVGSDPSRHAPDCPAPVLDALREERPATAGVMLAQDYADGVPLGGPQEMRFTLVGGSPSGFSGAGGTVTIRGGKPKEEP